MTDQIGKPLARSLQSPVSISVRGTVSNFVADSVLSILLAYARGSLWYHVGGFVGIYVRKPVKDSLLETLRGRND